MQSRIYQSPLGEIVLAADEIGLTELSFAGTAGFTNEPAIDRASPRGEKQSSVLEAAKRWLDLYFAGQEPDFTPPVHLAGTPFRMHVWKLLLEIPYGKTTTYGELAKRIASQKGLDRMSAQAIGGAVGHNPIAIIIPCHRVIGSDGSLTGYAGGLDKKQRLLALENVEMPVYNER